MKLTVDGRTVFATTGGTVFDPAKPAIVFIHYTPRSAQHISVVVNYPDLNAAPVWVVHDLGPRNAELRKLAPNRASFDFDEDQLVGVPLLR